jgi:integrase
MYGCICITNHRNSQWLSFDFNRRQTAKSKQCVSKNGIGCEADLWAQGTGWILFHDLRHCFNTYMRKAGVAESVIMRISGHSTRKMFNRYDKIDAEDMRQGVAQMGTFLASVDQNVDQSAK